MKLFCKICKKEIKDRMIGANLNNEHWHIKCYRNSKEGKRVEKEFNKFLLDNKLK